MHVLDRERAIVIVAEPGCEEEAATRLGRIGYDAVAGYLERGPPLVLDVRTTREWNDKHVENSVNMPLNHLEDRLGELSRDRMLAVLCAGGYRSAIATSLLQRQRFERIIEFSGGIAAWGTRTAAGTEELTDGLVHRATSALP
jgi:hydroxyacylglutathione hydrolase